LPTIGRVLACVIAIMVMMWPSIYNGGGILFFDTMAYFSGAARAAKTLFHLHTHWLHDAAGALPRLAPDPPGIAGSPPPAPPPPIGDPPQHGQVNAGRSVYYGLLVLLPETLGGLWLSVLVQATIMVWALALLLRTLGDRTGWLILPFCVFLGLFTTVAFFDSYLMPDFLAGIAILATAALIACGPTMSRGVRLQWFALLALALVSHTSHVLIAVLLTLAGMALARRVSGDARWRAATPVVTALVIAGVLQLGFSMAVTRLYGRDAAAPPFVTARLVSEKPAVAYLRETCPGDGFAVCRYLGQLPEDSDDFLWSHDPGKAVFATAGARVGQALSSEQFRFALAVLRYDFVGQTKASLGDFLDQLGRFSLSEFAYSPGLQSYLADMLPADLVEPVRQQKLSQGTFPLSQLSTVLGVVVVISAVVALYTLLAGSFGLRTVPPARRNFWILLVLVVGGVIANAAVTGILSTPHDRYQARVVWLIPAAVFLIAAARRHLLLSEREYRNDRPDD
jgi:hypothetical protein